MPVAFRACVVIGRTLCALMGLLALASCGGYGATSVGERTPQGRFPAAPGPASDVIATYRRAGLIAEAGPLPFTGLVRFFAARVPDSTLVLVTLSLANRSLAFVGEGNQYRAIYRVTMEVQRGTGVPRRIEARETVRLPAYRETARSDESIVFQQFVMMAPGENRMGLVLRDEGSPRMGSTSITLSVPRLGASTLSSPVLVYDATPRTTRDSLPAVIANPRATVVFGRDSTFLVYVEGYGLADQARIAVAALAGERQAPVWGDTARLTARGEIATALLAIPVSNLGAGQLALAVSVLGATDTVRTPLFVSFGEEWAMTSFTDMLSYLRYFATPEELKALREATPDRRAAAWVAFWRATDPVPTTPENEALRDYFGRVRIANDRFGEEGTQGWLTDRGRVLLTLGEPDELFEQDEISIRQRGGRSQIWVYDRYQVRLVFIDQTGFGRWRLTAASEADLLSAARERRR
jgi:GWxTD domain-containing protein